MARLLTDLRNSFWFLPGIIVLLAVALAFIALELDAMISPDTLSAYPRLFGANAAGARGLLSAIATSTATVAGVVFSITIVALSLTAAQYSPRVLRNFVADRANQLVLGVFVGLYVYCLLILRTVRGGEESFIPGISILLALLLALAAIGFFVFFIHHIAISIQVSQITARITHDTMDAIRATYPRPLEAEDEARPAEVDARTWHCVAARRTGYIQQAKTDLLASSAPGGRVVRMEKAVGEFVIEGHHLLSVSGNEPPSPQLVARLTSAYAINTYRDIRQDPAFGVEQLVDIALKALSPGMNDAGTARNVLHHLAAILCELAGRAMEGERHVVRDGELALIERVRTFEQIVDGSIGAIRHAAADNFGALLDTLGALAEVNRAVKSSERRAVVMKHVKAIGERLDRMDLQGEDGQASDAALSAVDERAATDVAST